VLAVYTRPRDGDCPLVCLEETSKQLIAETRVPISMKAGRPARFDYEYERNGTANLFMMFAPLEGWRAALIVAAVLGFEGTRIGLAASEAAKAKAGPPAAFRVEMAKPPHCSIKTQDRLFFL
jgi:hypothetical protein